MDQIKPIDYKLLFISSKKDDENYKKFINSIEKNGLSEKLKKNHISVGSNFVSEGNFNMMLYDSNGFPLETMKTFDEPNFIHTLKQMNILQNGGFAKNYEKKYNKYKSKYITSKNKTNLM